MRRAAAREPPSRCAADWSLPSLLKLPQQLDEAIDVALILIDSKADPEHVAAHVGDRVLRHQGGVPALSVRAAEREEPRVRPAVQRVEQFSMAKRRLADALEQLLL